MTSKKWTKKFGEAGLRGFIVNLINYKRQWWGTSNSLDRQDPASASDLPGSDKWEVMRFQMVKSFWLSAVRFRSKPADISVVAQPWKTWGVSVFMTNQFQKMFWRNDAALYCTLAHSLFSTAKELLWCFLLHELEAQQLPRQEEKKSMLSWGKKKQPKKKISALIHSKSFKAVV